MRQLPDDSLIRTPEEAARRIALEYLDEARKAAERFDDDQDQEALHDFRVAIRRLRSNLRAWREVLSPALKKKQHVALAELQRATGTSRDAEVLLEWLESQRTELADEHQVGLEWLRDHLEARRRDAYADVRVRVRKRFRKVYALLHRRLEVMRVKVHLAKPVEAPTYGASVADAIEQHLTTLLGRLDRIHAPSNIEEAHRARLAVKHLRYLVEPVRRFLPQSQPLVAKVKSLQDLLGELNDSSVLGDELRDTVGVAAAERARTLHALTLEANDEAFALESQRSESVGLLELTRRFQARVERLFETLQSGWLETEEGVEGHERSELVAMARGLVEALRSEARRGQEIERKFLLSGLPAAARGAVRQEIDQGWLPGSHLRERLRRVSRASNIEFYRTVKMGKGIRRLEVEESTNRRFFETVWPLTEGCRVHKRRYVVPAGELAWEIDEFLDRELFLAEIELPTEDHPVEVPEWLAPFVVREVTGESIYVNLHLAK
jgi:CHAD domain-containing protein/CYTH domain-containing protein